MTTTYQSRPTWAEIDLENLSSNLHSVRNFIGDGIRLMAVVKANAYGHGAVSCSRRLESEGVDWFGVASVEEGIELRNAGIERPILVLGGFWPGQERDLLANDLTPVIFRYELAELFDQAANAAGIIADYHLKVDTGMGRVGIRSVELPDVAVRLRALSNLRLDGLMTHFAVAEDLSQNDFTNSQMVRFADALSLLHALGFRPTFVDMANSPGAIAHPGSRGNMVRLGGVLYGLGDDVLPVNIDRPVLRPVLSLHTRVAAVKHVDAGESLGYGRTFQTERPSVIATIPIGYQDGYRRMLSNRARAIINGRFAPVVGTISMDWTIIDVTDVPDVKVEDEVRLIGADGERAITASELAAIAGTISYEITCGISSRVPRIYMHRLIQSNL
jgi:alanine racemase